MNSRTTQDSNFRYGHFTNSCLEIFDNVPVLEPIISSHIQEVYPTTSLDESSIEFEYETDRNVFIDMRDTHLLIKLKAHKNRFFDDYAEIDEHKDGGDGVLDETTTAADYSYYTHVNNLLHSLFSNVEVYLNNYQVYNSNGLYAHKAQISNEFNASTTSNVGILKCHGYSYEQKPGNHSDEVFKERSKNIADDQVVTLYGRLAIDFFQCEKMLMPGTRIRLKLIRSRPNFYMLSANPNVSLKIQDCSLFTRRVALNENYFQILKMQLSNMPASYNFMETIARTFIIPSRQNLFIQENVFNNAPIRRIAIAMNTNSSFTGSYPGNPFHYQKFDLRELRIIRGGRAVVHLNTEDDCRPYVTTMKAMSFNEEFPSIPVEDFNDHYILVFDLTSLQDCTEFIHYPELTGESLRVEMFFKTQLPSVTEVIILGERISTVRIDEHGAVAKNT